MFCLYYGTIAVTLYLSYIVQISYPVINLISK